jgi:hypothetical protein
MTSTSKSVRTWKHTFILQLCVPLCLLSELPESAGAAVIAVAADAVTADPERLVVRPEDMAAAICAASCAAEAPLLVLGRLPMFCSLFQGRLLHTSNSTDSRLVPLIGMPHLECKPVQSADIEQ